MRSVKTIARAVALGAMIAPLAAAATRGQGAPQGEHWKEVTSNDGSWRVHWRVIAESQPAEVPLPRKRFTVELRLESLRTPAETPKAVLVDAQMPEHGHGMNVLPTVSLAEGGAVRADGMLFHMNGRWEVDVDIDDGTTVERAQWNIGMY